VSKNVKLTTDQWDHVLHTVVDFVSLADNVHDLAHVESLLTRISADDDLATASASGLGYTEQAAESAETIAEFI
jgi:hypothetical protein